MARVWLQHVGRTSITIGYALVASVSDIKAAQKNLQKQPTYKLNDAVERMTTDLPSGREDKDDDRYQSQAK
jgi:hypothetical protein